MTRGSLLRGLVLAVVLLGPACAGIPMTHFYQLQVLPDASGGERPVVGVRPFVIDPPYDQDRIVYRVGEDSPEIGFYAYHRWAAPLSRMLAVLGASVLQDTPGIPSIEPAVRGRPYEALLEGRLLALEEIDLPEGQRVRVRLALTLRRTNGTKLWSETLGSESTARLDDVGKVVERMSAGLRETFAAAGPGIAAALALEDVD